MSQVRVMRMSPKAELPRYMSEGASGCDIKACLEEPLTLKPLDRIAVPTGLMFEIPAGWEIQVRPRSGLSLKKGLTVVNAPGTIDSDYRGEVKVLLVNLSPVEVTIDPGERVAQLVLARTERIVWIESDELEGSERGAGGFGSTGK